MGILMSEELVGRISPEELEIEIPEGATRIKDFIGVMIQTSIGLIPGNFDKVDVTSRGEVVSVTSGIHHHEAGLFCRGILVTGVMWIEGGKKEISWVLPEREEGYSYQVTNEGDHELPNVCITLFA